MSVPVQAMAAWTEIASKWKPIPKSPGYVASAAVSAAFVLLMPLLYMGVIVALGYGVYWHLTHDVPNFDRSISGRGAVAWVVIVYIGPALIGVTLIGFLLKPLFAPAGGEDEYIVLERFEEPRLHAFVDSVCSVIRAPAPKEIRVVADANASASFRRGWLSMLKSDDLVLTIGMTLPATMTKQQFAGVLAHEFGHFAQGSGMRLTYLVGSISHWFQRAAFQRDGWDEAIGNMLGESRTALGSILAIGVQVCVFVTRLFLMGLAILNTLVAGFMLRRMEYDADRHEIRFAGSAAFRGTCERLSAAQAGTGRAMEQARRMHVQRRAVPDDFPALVADWAAGLSPEELTGVVEEEQRRKAGWLSTHPSTKSRIAHAERLNEPGLMHDASPASELFHDFGGACKKATFGLFKEILGAHLATSTFVPTAPLLVNSGIRGKLSEEYTRMCGFEPPTWRPLKLTMRAVRDVEDPKALGRALLKARASVASLGALAAANVAQYRQLGESAVVWTGVRRAMDAKIGLDFKRLSLPSTTRVGVSTKLDELGNKSGVLSIILDDALDAANQRVCCALALYGVKGFERYVPDAGRRRARVDVLLGALHALMGTLEAARSMREDLAFLKTIESMIRNEADIQRHKPTLRTLADGVRDGLSKVRLDAGGTPSPFPNDEGVTSNMGELLIGATPAWRDFSEIFAAADQFVAQHQSAYARVMGELLELAEQAERAFEEAVKRTSSAGVSGHARADA